MLESKSYIATPPGTTIKEQLAERSMTQKEFASRMGFSEKHISHLLSGDVHLTPDVAERLELVLGIPARFWNKLETIYQEKRVKVKRELEAEKEKKLVSMYPYNELAKLKILPLASKAVDKISNLCKFFEVSNLSFVQKEDLTPIMCRKLSNNEKSTYTMLTLAQYAKKQARNIEVEPFQSDKLKHSLQNIRNFTTHSTVDFVSQLFDIFKECGIALVFLPQISGSFLHGISFYDQNTKKIVIGITMRGKYADRFWFSLFHELAHVILGHIYVAVEIDDDDKEVAADAMASEILIPHKELRKFKEQNDFSIASIKRFAGSIGTSEGIVIGRLQNDRCISYQMYNQYKIKFQDVL